MTTNNKIQLEKKAAAKLELLKRAAWNDLYIFTKFVVGRTLLEEQPHRELCEFLTAGLEDSELLNIDFEHPNMDEYTKTCRRSLKKLTMLPRGSFKSTIASNALPVWLLWHNPDLRIMIDSETLSNAKLYLAGIKDVITNNELVKMVCTDAQGNYVLEPNYKIAGGYTEDQLILKARKRVGLKEPTIFCSGVDNARTGLHMEVILMDDLVSERNVGTEQQIEKTKDHYRFSLSLLEPGGFQVVIGTRYHMADLYGDLLESDSFDKLIRPAILPDGSLYFPSRLSKEVLEALRKEQKSSIFASQYMLKPIDDESAEFKEGWLRYREDIPESEKYSIVERHILVDLAISEKETADYTVVMAVGVDDKKRIHVLEYERGHFNPKQTVEAIFDVYLRQKAQGYVKTVGIETVAYQKAMLYLVQDEMKRRAIPMPLKELKADRDKIRRIRTLQPLFERGEVFISRVHKEFKQELLEFPFSQHDDVIDAFAYIEQVMRAGNIRNKPLKPVYKAGNSVTNY
jgi:predicted phage terminase large subunit-like protein